MRAESDILVRVLLKLATQGIAALPLHDAILLPKSQTEVARTEMHDSAHAVAGCDLPTGTKHAF